MGMMNKGVFREEGDILRYTRERVVTGGKFKEVKIYSLTSEESPRHRKKVRKKLSAPKQVKQDWKHAQEYAVQLVNANFGNGDYLLDLTYETEPENRERAEKDVLNFINRLKTLYRKLGVPFRAFWVTGGGHPKKNGEEGLTRYHHHLIISGGVDRDLIEAKWKEGRVKCSRAKILQKDFGLEGRARYMVKPTHSSGEPNAKRWHACNLKKPVETINDNRYDGVDANRLGKAINEGRGNPLICRNYQGWEPVDANVNINPVTNLEEIIIKLRRKE